MLGLVVKGAYVDREPGTVRQFLAASGASTPTAMTLRAAAELAFGPPDLSERWVRGRQLWVLRRRRIDTDVTIQIDGRVVEVVGQCDTHDQKSFVSWLLVGWRRFSTFAGRGPRARPGRRGCGREHSRGMS